MYTTFSVFFLACKKMDVSSTLQEKNYELEFFNVSPNANPTLLRVINKMKRENDKYHFVNDFVRREGLPKWEYSMIVPNNSNLYYRDNVDSMAIDTVILIPIIPDQSGFVKDVISCFVTSDSIYQAVIKGEEYQQFGYEPNTDGKPNAKEISFMFMAFEKKVFDKKFFDITDRALAQKLLGDSVLQEDQHILVNDDGNGNYSAYKVAPFANVPLSTGVIVIGYLPAATVGVSPWWMYGLGLGMNNMPGGSGGSGWWSPDGNTGGGGGSAPSGGGPGGSAPPTTGWQVPPCGVSKVGDVFYRVSCPIVPPDDVPEMLKNLAEKTQQKSVDLFNTADIPDVDGYKYEWSHIIVKNTDGVIYAKNKKTDNEKDQVSFNWYTTANETVIACEHTHQSESSNLTDRPGPDIGDVLKMRQYRNTPAFTSFINCGNIKYALVIENNAKFIAWANQYVMPAAQDNLDSIFIANTKSNSNYSTNYQLAQVQTLISMMGSVSDNGIGIYQTSDPDMLNFIKLN